ncbi:hypothetical protein [Nocardia sp. 348MFTsu5.1]|uniref:hypothetical protein n=1 Tax=Nocardia sp. 348MFTsu5.1 TaxID=1172185 RepID=UPI000365DF78|nr:hypothetical protein [Nocardia sp. 348MFTsu5.1]
MTTRILTKVEWNALSPAERFDKLSAMPEFDPVNDFLTDYGRNALTDGAQDVTQHWSISVVPQTRMTADGKEFRPFTLNVGPMETAYMVVLDAADLNRRKLFGCVYVARTHFLDATGRSVEELIDENPLLDYDPDVKFNSAKDDGLRIYWDATNPASVAALNAIPWKQSAVVLVNRLRTLKLAGGRVRAHSTALADLLIG